MRFILFLILSLSGATAQTVSLGAIGGGRLTGDMTGAGAISQSRSYVLGPAAGLDLPFHFSVEVDALYRREGYQSAFSNFASNIFSVERANSWEFPLLLQYRLPGALVKPFVEIGYAPRVIHGTVSSDYTALFPQTLPTTHETSKTPWPASQGIVIGGGVRAGLGPLRISPTLRYTHWNNSTVTGFFGDGPSFASSQEQVDLMVGIAWRKHVR